MREDPATARGWKQWLESRERLHVRKFLGTYSEEYDEYRDAWEQDYLRGKGADGREAPEHQTKLRRRQFADRDAE